VQCVENNRFEFGVGGVDTDAATRQSGKYLRVFAVSFLQKAREILLQVQVSSACNSCLDHDPRQTKRFCWTARNGDEGKSACTGADVDLEIYKIAAGIRKLE
jgi:hypothetical protein